MSSAFFKIESIKTHGVRAENIEETIEKANASITLIEDGKFSVVDLLNVSDAFCSLPLDEESNPIIPIDQYGMFDTLIKEARKFDALLLLKHKAQELVNPLEGNAVVSPDDRIKELYSISSLINLIVRNHGEFNIGLASGLCINELVEEISTIFAIESIDETSKSMLNELLIMNYDNAFKLLSNSITYNEEMDDKLEHIAFCTINTANRVDLDAFLIRLSESIDKRRNYFISDKFVDLDTIVNRNWFGRYIYIIMMGGKRMYSLKKRMNKDQNGVIKIALKELFKEIADNSLQFTGVYWKRINDIKNLD
jgi:hypothetical protein